ncbi:MAG: hypothetical protein K8R59_16700 [Thermoanaerobaculales bacterium]|nr:hypothetical protein [Thermoanaerobaculales bacterium]
MEEANLLLEWLEMAKAELEDSGYVCRVQDPSRSKTCTAVDLDGRRFIGTVSYWPPDKFEFQFNSCDSGEVVVLEIKHFSTRASVASFVRELLHSITTDP